MTLDRRTRSNGHVDLIFTACPRCGGEIGETEQFPSHWREKCPENTEASDD